MKIDDKIFNYCYYDILATAAAYEHLSADLEERKILDVSEDEEA